MFTKKLGAAVLGSVGFITANALMIGTPAVAATTCSASGVLNPANYTIVLYNATSNTCSVFDAQFGPLAPQIAATDLGFYTIAIALGEPDTYAATGVVSGNPARPLVTAATINGGAMGLLPNGTVFGLSQNLSGLIAMNSFATLSGVDYLMTTNWRADGGANIYFIDGEVSVVPLPAALPLFATGVAAVAYAGRRKRKAKAMHAAA